ncbi:hypothetical protein A2415_05120 [candidate division WWE3 bacterium RIFOXYC1_FULL_39_7]|uniref:Acylphosphatase-like domain-containing protein n=2 Tax=Katanobacteria TaxID=422282 RepID=A0A1F4X7S3_UNCKA|nr:MAG: hypothetical protein A2415_05120 [candidate division WWE3 bacterium RIFOXYC1_FULL_39_7]OGC77734.1 MAG: hypothetical protein A2619_03590 [candidate division WWE3 bacterium RIFOXYD1_FULL_39_9]
MKRETQKLKMNIRGEFRKLWANLFLKRKITNLGVIVDKINGAKKNQVEIVVSGEKSRLWDVVKWSRKQDLFFVLNEVVFEFVDVEAE